MSVQLELADIQGNVLTAYGRLGFPKGRFLLLHVAKPPAGQKLLQMLRRQVTTALRWPSSKDEMVAGRVYQTRPEVALNFAFTFRGLLALGVPIRTLRVMPQEVLDGMAARADILGDNNPCIAEAWDPVWLEPKRVHVLVTLNAQMTEAGEAVPRLDEMTREIIALCDQTEGDVTVLSGHRNSDPRWQDLSAILAPTPNGSWQPTPMEHFGFTDAIGDPVFEGQHAPEKMNERVIGQGKLLPDQSWAPLATGEFLLGHPDESQEIPGAGLPLDFSRNGTFFAYRKLHQNVAAFRDWIAKTATQYAAMMELPPDEAAETLKAKMAGRWSNGVPLMLTTSWAEARAIGDRLAQAIASGDSVTRRAIEQSLVDFTFRADGQGAKCPLNSHLRRSNTRDMLDPYLSSDDPKKLNGSVLNNRRRILRRGLPYGAGDDDLGEHGIVMLAGCASLFRQFEFVQQQWMQYGLDFNSGNDTCPIIGNHDAESKFVISTEASSGKSPFICSGMPQFVETRGGEYFFVPSMTALRMIATGLVDPT